MNKPYYELKTDILNQFKIENKYLDYTMPEHFHRNYEMQYVLEGNYLPTINNKEYIFTPNDIVFMPSYYHHSAKIANNTKSILLIFPYTATVDFSDLVDNKTINCQLLDKEFNREKILPIMQHFLKFPMQLDSSIISKGYVNVILGNLVQHYGLVDNNLTVNPEIIIKIIQYVDQNYSQQLSLDSISEYFGYNKFYFSKLFNKAIGISLSNYINQVRVQKFVKLYSSSDADINILNLVFACGFDSLPTFYRTFNELFNTTPKQFFKQKQKDIFW